MIRACSLCSDVKCSMSAADLDSRRGTSCCIAASNAGTCPSWSPSSPSSVVGCCVTLRLMAASKLCMAGDSGCLRHGSTVSPSADEAEVQHTPSPLFLLATLLACVNVRGADPAILPNKHTQGLYTDCGTLAEFVYRIRRTSASRRASSQSHDVSLFRGACGGKRR